MHTKIYLGIAGLVVVLGGAFVLTRGHAPSADVAAPAGAGAGAAQASAQIAPDFTLDAIDGKTLSLSDYKGKKAVVLDFFATWCPNCRRDIPHQEAFYEKYKDTVEVVGVDLQEDPALVKSFAAQLGITYPVVLDPSGVATQAYGARYTNYHVLIGKDGTVVGTIPGDISEADFEKLAAL